MSDSSAESTPALLDRFRDAFDRGDAVTFAILVAETFSTAAGVDLPLCDGCMDSALARASKDHDVAADQRDAAYHLVAELKGRVDRRKAHPSSLNVILASTGLMAGIPAGNLEKYKVASKRDLLAALEQEELNLEAEILGLRQKIGGDAFVAGASASTPVSPPSTLVCRKSVHQEKSRLKDIRRQVHTLESNAWQEYRNLAAALLAAREKMSSLYDRDRRYRDTLARMRYLTVHNDAFFIWHRGPFVTINGCRLGKLPGHSVEWPEINAGLGQVALLLTIIANRISYKFQRYQIIPMGSFACIAPTGDEHSSYELHYSNRYFAQTRMNTALKAMLTCIAELGEYAQNMDRSFWWPHPITHGGERIADLHITIGAKDAQWTRAMKCALTDLKWLLAWAYRQPE
jgi:hypothetical protein